MDAVISTRSAHWDGGSTGDWEVKDTVVQPTLSNSTNSR